MELNNNIFNNKENNINGGYNMKKEEKTREERILDFAIKDCSQKIAESAQDYVPEYNNFSPHEIAFYIPGTSNIAKIIIKQDEEEYKTQRRVVVGVHHQNSDVLMSNYVFKGTKKEVIEYLKSLSNERFEEILENIKELSRKSDDYHSSL